MHFLPNLSHKQNSQNLRPFLIWVLQVFCVMSIHVPSKLWTYQIPSNGKCIPLHEAREWSNEIEKEENGIINKVLKKCCKFRETNPELC